MIRLDVKNCKILTEKQQLSSWKIDKYEYLRGEEILPSDQIRITDKLSLHIFL